MNNAAATTAKMPLTAKCSAVRYAKNGMTTSNSRNTVGVSRPSARTRPSTNITIAASTRPTTTPPTKSNRKVAVALNNENVPVTAAAMANSNATTPDASLNKASPESNDFWRSVSLTSLPMAATAAASVGPSAAPSAKAAARGIDGTIRFSTKPITSAVMNTRPIASEMMCPLFFQSAPLSAWRDSSKSSGAIKMSRKSSGSEITAEGSSAIKKPTTAPRAICTSGMAKRENTWSKMLETRTHPSSSKTTSNDSMGLL